MKEDLPVPPIVYKGRKIDRHLLSETLTKMFRLEECRAAKSDKVVSISLARVLARPWHPGRLQRMRGWDWRKDPIHVVAACLGNYHFYVISDGNHRAAVGLERGGAAIKAKISGYNYIDPRRFLYIRDEQTLWYKVDSQRPVYASYERVDTNLSTPMLELLSFLGVAVRQELYP